MIARQDLKEIVDYIAQDSIENALLVLDKLQAKAADLINHPERGRVPPELVDTGIAVYREIIVKPWRVVYRIDGDGVIVPAVLDSRRDLQAILLNRLLR